ncbi:carboxypeptidase-like regulatory domain-containing protein, partial [Pontibacter harenae]|uniref:carboxypeptidase-like regulatory domain-containing protein n=1 Tax=Pontibacter harenae TaxID=2894083 RepID=UPI001E4FAFBD
ALPGVSIMIKNSNRGTVTGSDGRYTLNAEATDTLVYRFIGFEERRLAAGDKETQRVVLEQSIRPGITHEANEERVEGKPSPVKERSAAQAQVAGSNGAKARTEIKQEALNEVLVEGRRLDATAVTVKGGQPVNAGTATVAGGKSGSSDKAISIKGASAGENKEPAYFIYESDAFKGLASGTDAFAKAAAKGRAVADLKDIEPESIQSIHVLRDRLAVAAFGDAAKNGAVLITLKENALQPVTAEHTEEFVVYPVPSEGFVKIRFYLNTKQHVKADAVDFNGKNVKTFTNQVLDSGWHEFEWDASNSPAGTYIIILNKETGVANKKILLK